MVAGLDLSSVVGEEVLDEPLLLSVLSCPVRRSGEFSASPEDPIGPRRTARLLRGVVVGAKHNGPSKKPLKTCQGGGRNTFFAIGLGRFMPTALLPLRASTLLPIVRRINPD